ncbi:type I-E CRISPR-associated endoribonuclease Cas2 [Nonomuraea sp. NPDC049607]|uniref:type I-E CRISPR-associated endoribonuclease Cas2 n=1 Tax=Nonomuraea sp. NPDC049607 TaxID=3154732 RepID=UPI00344859D6
MTCTAGSSVFCPADNEQDFVVRTAGERRRHVADFDGLQLIRFLPETPAQH